jgi:hypothetical protein
LTNLRYGRHVEMTKIPAHTVAARKGLIIEKIVNDNKQIAAMAIKGSIKSAVLFFIAFNLNMLCQG